MLSQHSPHKQSTTTSQHDQNILKNIKMLLLNFMNETNGSTETMSREEMFGMYFVVLFL